ncbi:MAG: ATP-dependent zinc protease [Candidatus Anaerobiospirillum pullicola]|uniref:ATP-dependent zinc protease n=1 Tax=Candidatus Anaerobiospirillum pullicola TaxID=2838451 RepID=A0A948TG60_9GAMM|nr:ATP-dependent zinc protease [Candidatus Anaerobiospirillum pullicola]
MSKATNEHLLQMQGQIQSINEELSSQRATLGRLSAELVAQRQENDEFRRNLLNELKALRRQNQSLLDNLYDNNLLLGSNDRSEVKPLRNYDLQTPDGKIYLGEDEYIYIKEADATFDSRIDTGAAVSSISARNITEFERNGKRWYRFTIEANDHNIEVEAPFVRTSIIRQSSSQKSIERVVVALNIKVGDYSAQTEFTLTDRSHMQYPVLIGRTMIQDIAVVDVSRDHIQGRNKDTFLVLNGDDYEKAMKEGNDPNAEYKAKRESMAGQVAFPSQEYGDNLGPNSENALPAVRNQRQDEANDKKLRQEQQAKANDAATTAQDKATDKATDKDAAAKDDAKSDSKADADTDSKADDAAKKEQ